MAKLFPEPKSIGRIFQFLVAALESEESESWLHHLLPV